MLKYFTIFVLFSVFGNTALSNSSPAEKHYKNAAAYHTIGEFEQAISEYKKAIALDPNSPIIYNRLGIAYSELKQYDAALDAYQTALALFPMAAEPHYNIGLVYLKKGALLDATKAFKQAIAVDLKWGDAYAGLGEVGLKQGDFEQAARAIAFRTRLRTINMPSLLPQL